MKYLCLVYGEEKAIQTMDERLCLDYDESVRESGHCIASEALQPVATATTVRVRNGKVSVTDGPFAETKEVIGGFAILNYASHEEAIAGARRVLQIHAEHGITDLEIELRPMMNPADCGAQPQASAAA